MTNQASNQIESLSAATYQERIERYRIFRHDEMPEEHKQAMREAGIDPDNHWSLIWSFRSLEAAEHTLKLERERAASWQTYKIVDAGKAEVINRPIW